MAIRFNGLTVMGYGLQWVKVDSEKDLARRTVHLLEDRRVLFGERHLEDEYDCVRSVLEIRQALAELIDKSKPGKQLEASMRGVMGACRRFLTLAGRDGERFRQGFHAMPGNDPFTRALAELRVLVGIQVGLISNFYGVDLTDDLASIVPRSEDEEDEEDDAGWLADQTR